MEIQLEELIAQIKKDGVLEAQNESEKIIESAKAEAEKIVADAKAEAEKLLASAKAENERTVRAAEDSIRQAGRNLLLSFRESVARELDAVIGDKVAEAYSGDSAASLIAKAVEAWAKNTDTDELSVLLNKDELSALESSLLASLKEKISGGVTLLPSDSFVGGFRVSSNGKNVYYDYSSDAVVDMLSSYLNPKITALMKEAE